MLSFLTLEIKPILRYDINMPMWRNWFTRTTQNRMDASPCGFDSHHRHHKKMIKDKILDFEWNSKIAYAVGLITTDGSLSKDGRHIVLVSTDYQILENFQKCLNFDTKITNKLPGIWSKKKVYKVQFSNVNFYRWLMTIGLMPNKTTVISSLKIPDKYFRDFLRGHLDGDGDVITYLDKYNKKSEKYVYERLYTKFCSASFEHILWLRSKIQKILNISGSLTKFVMKDRVLPQWRLRFAKNDSLKLYYWMYYSDDVLCLDRKKEKFEEFLKSKKVR